MPSPPQRPTTWPDYAPDPPARKKRRPPRRSSRRNPWSALVVIMLVLGVGFGAAAYLGVRYMQRQAVAPVNEGGKGGKGASSAGTTAVAPEATTTARAIKLGQVAKDGDFAFKVTKVTTGARSTFVYVTVKNLGAKDVPLAPSIQQLTDGEGAIYPADAGGGSVKVQRFWNPVPAGMARRGIMIFNVARSAKQATVELHGTPGTQGLTVTLPTAG